MSDSEERAKRLAIIAKNVDRLISVDASGRGLIGQLYAVAREKQGQDLAFMAAERLVERVTKGSVVIITPGMLINPFRVLGESDGPIGSASLARALQMGLGAKPLFVIEDVLVPVMEATARAANLNVMPVDRFKNVDLSCAVVGFPTGEAAAKEAAKNMLDEFSPKAVVAIERRGPNKNGVYHAVGGKDMAPDEAMEGQIFDEAKRRGVFTIGIGDGGNEIGMGVIREEAAHMIPFGTKCTCPCQGGIFDATVTDVLIAAAVSNWGAYGIEACLAALLDRPELLHDAAMETRMMNACANAGGIDGISCLPEVSVDGMPLETHLGVLSLLAQTIRAVAFGHPRTVHLK